MASRSPGVWLLRTSGPARVGHLGRWEVRNEIRAKKCGYQAVAKCWVGCWILLDRRAGRSPEGYPTCLRFQSESHAAWSSSGSKWGFLVNAFGSARLRKSSGCLGAQCVPKQTLDFETGRWDTEWDHSPWRTCFPPAATRPEALLRSQGCCLLSHCFRDSLL